MRGEAVLFPTTKRPSGGEGECALVRGEDPRLSADYLLAAEERKDRCHSLGSSSSGVCREPLPFSKLYLAENVFSRTVNGMVCTKVYLT